MSTLGDDAIISGNLHDIAPVESLFSIALDLYVGWAEGGEGPLAVGIAHGDYSDAEILECLKADTLDLANKIEREQAKRLVRSVGYITGLDADGAMNDGKMIRVKSRFHLEEGQNMKFWVWNRSKGALSTGADVQVFGSHFARRT